MTAAGVARAEVVWEHHGAGYRLWCDDPFARLVYAIEGVVRLKRASNANTCWEVTLDPRFDVPSIEAAIYELAKQAEASPGIGRWPQ